ncbi:amidohydrolase [Pseudoruegeria sp. SK021]|uniref:amidohydrolase family protein n=1 Tax=Pseudoruegeria sp. SK021 TaxID=1933035 RepID=UPI000A264B47|nr:amidohydrolase family protein [Pseudoruegeria sp. SK021]OSP53947.1 amidohydrolase [Pseudoruegeria sp. SK021]
MTNLIDAHQHYWNPARGDYGWMPADDPILSRAYGPADLAPLLAKNGIGHTILVQAAPSIAETEYMLGLADATPSIAGVIGWVDFERPDDLTALTRLAQHPRFLGVRPMIQDLEDDNWMLRDDVQWGFQAVRDLGLRFEALGFARHLKQFRTILTRYPEMATVINHCMKPQICDPQSFGPWADGMARLAADTTTFCKLSGLVTEASADWTIAELQPYADHILQVFGPGRVMWGSDWPVCQLASSYDDWVTAARTLTAGLSPADQALIFGGTAATFYGLTA